MPPYPLWAYVETDSNSALDHCHYDVHSANYGGGESYVVGRRILERVQHHLGLEMLRAHPTPRIAIPYDGIPHFA